MVMLNTHPTPTPRIIRECFLCFSNLITSYSILIFQFFSMGFRTHLCAHFYDVAHMIIRCGILYHDLRAAQKASKEYKPNPAEVPISAVTPFGRCYAKCVQVCSLSCSIIDQITFVDPRSGIGISENMSTENEFHNYFSIGPVRF